MKSANDHVRSNKNSVTEELVILAEPDLDDPGNRRRTSGGVHAPLFYPVQNGQRDGPPRVTCKMRGRNHDVSPQRPVVPQRFRNAEEYV